MSRLHMDTLLHPVRLRIVWLVAGREMTSKQIAKLLPDVPQATLYRHITKLVKVGILKVVRENPARGVSEKVYILDESMSHIGRKEFSKANRADHLRYFQAFLGMVHPLYEAYVESVSPQEVSESVSYNMVAIYVSDEELKTFMDKLRSAYGEISENAETRARKRYYLGSIFFPSKKEDFEEW